MSIITKKNLLTTVLVVLIIINIVALGTFFFWPHHPFDKRDAGNCKQHNPGDFLKKELNLTADQEKKMNEMRITHSDTLSVLAKMMQEKRKLLSGEMMKTNPDSTLLFKTCDEIGDIYAAIRKLNVIHYWQMKSICDTDQQKKLDSVFKGIFCCDETMLGRFGKHEHGGSQCMKDKEHKGCQFNQDK
jgi:Spy/CpxP family protein refolding chaperone